MTAEELFDRYEACGFLYPAKREQLAPFIDTVRTTWNASLKADMADCVHHCLTCTNSERGAWGTVSMWRSSARRAHSQHLVSSGWPGCSRNVMLAAQDWWDGSGVEFAEKWFRSENKYPNRIFGSVPDRLGHANSTLERRALFASGRDHEHNPDVPVEVHLVGDDAGIVARDVLARLTDPVVAAAEELDTGDVSLNELNEAYARVGLQRSRRVHMATIPGHAQPVGLASAYRGPLGLNFSFLENRCDIWLDRQLDETERRSVASALLDASRSTYEDCPLPYILVTCDEPTLEVLLNWTHGQHIRTYERCIWTRSGFWDWYCHVDSFYQRVMELEERRIARMMSKSAEEASS